MTKYIGNVYPALVQQIDPARRSARRTEGDAVASVESTLRDIMGWQPRAQDPDGFTAALKATFTLREEAGHIEYEIVQRNYAVQLQADMGAVTGAQASLFTRAKNALDDALPLLRGLTPLRTDADSQDTEATREIVAALFTDLVAELGAVGGPRCQRVENLLQQMVGELDDDLAPDPAVVRGQLGELRRRFGLERDRVGRLDEEKNLTNYWTLVEYVGDIRRSYLNSRPYFQRGGDKTFYGTQLVLLSRQLALIAGTVEEANFVFDSIFIEDAQRQALLLRFVSRNLGAPMTVYELLDWVSRVATGDGPRLIQNAGRDGLGSLVSTLQQLGNLLFATLQPNRAQISNANDLPKGFWEERVQRALRELHAQVVEAGKLADKQMRSPDGGGATVPVLRRVCWVRSMHGDRIQVEGENFDLAAQLIFTDEVNAEYFMNVNFSSSETLTAGWPPGMLGFARGIPKDTKFWAHVVNGSTKDSNKEPVEWV